MSKVIQKAQSNGVSIITCGFGFFVNNSMLNYLSSETGGYNYNLYDRNEYEAFFKTILHRLNNNVEITEGSLDIIDDNLTVFCSYMKEDNALMVDNFSGKNTGFQDRADYRKQVTTQTTAQSEDYSYTITSAQIHEMMKENGDGLVYNLLLDKII